MFLVRALVFLILSCIGASAQTSPGFIPGKPLCADYPSVQCPAPANPLSLNQAFEAKQDYPLTPAAVPGVDGVTFSGVPSVGQVAVATGPNAATWMNVSISAITGSATVGDMVCVGPGTTQAQDCSNVSGASPILVGPQAVTSLPGGPLGTNGIAITNGSLNVWVPQTYGWAGAAAGACVIVGEAFPNPVGTTADNCPIGPSVGLGSAEPPSGYARYPLEDSVGMVVYNRATPAYIGSKTGTFTTTTFVPNTPYSPTQVSRFRYQMPVKTNDSPLPYWMVLTSWALDGSSLTGLGWFLQGCTIPCATGLVPAGTSVIVGEVGKIYGMNIVSERDSGTTPTMNVALELDPINSTGIDDVGNDQSITPYDGGLNIANLGTNIVSFGVLVNGNFNSQFIAEGSSTNAFDVSPTAGHAVTYGYHAFGTGVSVAFFSQTAQEALRVSTTAGDITGRVLSSGNAEWGEQTTTAGNNTQSFFSSAGGAGKPDAIWTYSGGTGNNDGTVTLAAGTMFTNAVTYFGDSSTATPATGAIGITGISGAPTMSVGSGAIWLTNASGLHLTGDGSSNDVVITNKNNGAVITIPTGTTTATFGGSINAPSLASAGTAASALCVTSAGSVFTKSGVNCF